MSHDARQVEADVGPVVGIDLFLVPEVAVETHFSSDLDETSARCSTEFPGAASTAAGSLSSGEKPTITAPR
jgi:hypothetical protein